MQYECDEPNRFDNKSYLINMLPEVLFPDQNITHFFDRIVLRFRVVRFRVFSGNIWYLKYKRCF